MDDRGWLATCKIIEFGDRMMSPRAAVRERKMEEWMLMQTRRVILNY